LLSDAKSTNNGACFKRRGTVAATRNEKNGSQKAICPQEIIYSHPQSGDTARQSRETAITDFKKTAAVREKGIIVFIPWRNGNTLDDDKRAALRDKSLSNDLQFSLAKEIETFDRKVYHQWILLLR
jgi:hypothetical protein